MILAPSLDAQIACAEEDDCVLEAWTAEEIRRAAPEMAGCWAFGGSAHQTLQSPFSDEVYDVPLSGRVELTLEETVDIWADFEGRRHELALRVRGSEVRTAYWIPDPTGEAFLVKWREADTSSGHLVLTASMDGSSGSASVSVPGHHMGVVLEPHEISVERCPER